MSAQSERILAGFLGIAGWLVIYALLWMGLWS